jgi:sec-independent protein translocase protein TatC
MAKPARKQTVEEDEDVAETTRAKELEGSRMPFLSHLKELKVRVRNAAIGFVVAFGVSFYFAKDIFNWIKEPLRNVWDEKKLGPFHVAFGALTEPFWVEMSVALWAALFIASPFIFYQLWKFIAPGLYKRERRITVLFALFSAVFFVSGALFCYEFVLERLYKFLLGYASKETMAVVMLQEYLDLTRNMMLAFGAVFELPLLIYFLSMVGLVTHRGLWKFNRWFVVIAFVIGALLTPSPDVVSQIMMATPMIALYNLSIIISWRITLRRERANKDLEAREKAADEAEREELRKRKAAKQPDDEEERDD